MHPGRTKRTEYHPSLGPSLAAASVSSTTRELCPIPLCVAVLFLLDVPQALIHGLNRHYYSIAINYRKNELEEKMLLNLHKKKKWADGLTLKPFEEHSKNNEATVKVSGRTVKNEESYHMQYVCA